MYILGLQDSILSVIFVSIPCRGTTHWNVVVSSRDNDAQRSIFLNLCSMIWTPMHCCHLFCNPPLLSGCVFLLEKVKFCPTLLFLRVFLLSQEDTQGLWMVILAALFYNIALDTLYLVDLSLQSSPN